jgi:hypothetical protein
LLPLLLVEDGVSMTEVGVRGVRGVRGDLGVVEDDP